MPDTGNKLSYMSLHEAIFLAVSEWRKSGYLCEEYPAISEILEYQSDPENGTLRFLRPPQLRALEVYWYLRLVQKTPAIPKLYQTLFPNKKDLREALGLNTQDMLEFVADYGLDAVFEKMLSDETFVKNHKLEALRETFALDYPSYIFALAMGSGKTALIGAIIATEFSMALEYPEGPFVQNALVFAPGLTILGSLRELAQLPYDRILPPRFHKFFSSSIKLIFTRDGDPDIPVIRGDTFNLIVTNTEKIRIQKDAIRKSDLGSIISASKEDEAKGEVANRRLQAIASLPHLAVFSDEAHHAFGRSMGDRLKRVRETIDYLHRESPNLICVVNTTGTPYLNKQPLRDVVIWYGLRQGIEDGILKQPGKVQGYSFDDQSSDDFIAEVVSDFITNYRDIALPDGSPSKLALYFPQVDDLKELRPVIEAKLLSLGFPTDLILENTNQATPAELAAFNRLNDPAATHRIILLVNKGTEGWNCPSLFACGLARKLKTSNNFVLQAASRCLRQIPGNTATATIYLSNENRATLEKELSETYGETLLDLQQAATRSRLTNIRLRKLPLPPIRVRRIIRTVVAASTQASSYTLRKPATVAEARLDRTDFTLGSELQKGRLLVQMADTVEIKPQAEFLSLYEAAVELAATYRLDAFELREKLEEIYPQGQIPQNALTPLARQIEDQLCNYEVKEEWIEEALALIKPEGFQHIDTVEGDAWVAQISYPIDREKLLINFEAWKSKNAKDFGFHYSPYNFDSGAEAEFFAQVLQQLNLHPDAVEDIYFTGALTSPDKTDFSIAYKGVDGRWHDYTPDFVIRRKDGRCLIIEIKSEQHQASVEHDLELDRQGQASITKEGAKAVALRRFAGVDSSRLHYEILFAGTAIGQDKLGTLRAFAEGKALNGFPAFEPSKMEFPIGTLEQDDPFFDYVEEARRNSGKVPRKLPPLFDEAE